MHLAQRERSMLSKMTAFVLAAALVSGVQAQDPARYDYDRQSDQGRARGLHWHSLVMPARTESDLITDRNRIFVRRTRTRARARTRAS
jgi:hypothetical protein